MADLKAVKLITEEAENIQLVEAVKDSGSKELYLEGIFSTHSKENKNGRKYKKDLLEREISKLMPEIKAGRLYGELSHPEKPEVNLERAAILIESLDWSGEHINGKAAVLETPMGDIVRGCLKKGMVGISSRGLGTVSEDGWVNEDYQMITYDVVSQPSNAPSWVKGICESKQYYINESGIIVRVESTVSANEKKDAVQDALKDMEQKIQEMVEATVETKLADKKPHEPQINEAEAKKMFTDLLKNTLKDSFEKLF